jgi:hypothetical protein
MGVRAFQNCSLTRRALAVGLFSAAAASLSPLSLADAKIPIRFRGDWQGTLVNAELPSEHGELQWLNPMHTRILIDADGASLFRRVEGRWEFDTSNFQIAVHGSNAVLNLLWDHNSSAGSWSIAVKLVDTQHLHVAFMRHYKDKEVHLSDPKVVTVDVAYGTLERAPEAK